MVRMLFCLALGTATVGCAPPQWTEMLGESIKHFTGKMKVGTGAEKVWLTNTADSACDRGCPLSCGGGKEGGGAAKGLGGLFGGFKSADGSGPHDRLAYEVLSNYLTQKKKMKVMESHRHNYAAELGAETRRKIEVMNDTGKNIMSGMSCEDLCLLDEAKKRKADKVLVYHIIEMKDQEMTIHYRLSDVSTGIVEAAQTIEVKELKARDYSF